MKTKELIERLQKEDPSGNEECCVGNVDIFFVSKEPAYWDGRQEILIRDPEKAPYYNVSGAKRTAAGHKIQIHLHDISSALWENPELPVDYSELGNEDCIKQYKESDDKMRKASVDNSKEMERELFQEWALKKIGAPNDWSNEKKEDLKKKARLFFEKEQIDYKSEFPEHLINFKQYDEKLKCNIHPSYATRRYMEWDEKYDVEYEAWGWRIIEK